MTTREIREQLGRVKPYYLRNEMLRALAALITGLKGLEGGGLPSMDIRGPLREAISLVTRDQQVKELLTSPLVYQPGQEKAVLAQIIPIYKALSDAQNAENHDQALERKIQLDQNYTLGLRHLEQNRVSEADAAFAQAVTLYRDEHRIFCMIAKALQGAGEIRRAYPYAKRGAEALPGEPDAQELFAEIARLREEL